MTGFYQTLVRRYSRESGAYLGLLRSVLLDIELADDLRATGLDAEAWRVLRDTRQRMQRRITEIEARAEQGEAA